MPIEEILDDDGIVRRLGYVRPAVEYSRMMRATRTSITTLREAAGLPPTIPRSEWVDRDYCIGWGTEFILDQKSTSACTGFSAASGMMRQRHLRGQPFHRLSGGSVYAQINGGRDNGSNIIDSMNAVERKGACLESEMPLPKIFTRDMPGAGTWFRESVAVTVDTFDEIATAILMGMVPQFPVQVGNRYGKFDGDGFAGFDNGYGNHSVHGAGLKWFANRNAWGIAQPNTWGVSWGPFRNGICYLTEKHINACASDDDSYAHSATLNPESSSGASE